ncbi:MAG: SDR family oxidoreductase [Desulfovibrio sp.]|uniref:SDR family NAD(P)-dependent oxidoreductase n=1 Tax=Desulfovibrio sp. TaxID=885 RepID=UPI0039E5357D
MTPLTPESRILVTGASSGIGKAVALLCNQMGATVIANGRDQARLQELKISCEHPELLHIEPRDLLEDMDSLPQWVTDLRKKYGKLCGLVCCAGFAAVIPLRAYDRNAAADIYDIHVHAPLLLTKGFADKRNNMGQGSSIVFLSSAAALAKEAGLAAYGGAKAAVQAATISLSRELAPQGLRINAVAPAMVRTPMSEKYFAMLSPESREQALAAYPLGIGTPEDVAQTITFLLGDASKWVTGQTIVMDGGRY